MRIWKLAAPIVVGLAVLLAACGGSSSNTSATRTVDIDMTDNAYNPATLTVTKGETVRFRFHNQGKAMHEALIGTDKTQAEHAADMKAGTTMGGMDHGSGDSTMVTVKPGKTGELTYQFMDAGTMLIGCHQPGHYEAGMRAVVAVQ